MEILFVNDKAVEADTAASLLHALRKQGMEIPSLCFHPAMDGYGSCGLCMVEVYSQGIWKIEHACLLRPTEGMQIRLDTPNIIKQRAIAARLLLRRGPFLNKHTEKYLCTLVAQASKYGLADGFKVSDDLEGMRGALYHPINIGCILCGLCIRTCSKAGKGCLTFLGKGKNLRVGFVSQKGNASGCGSCTACSHVCPTGFIFPDARHAFQSGIYSNSH